VLSLNDPDEDIQVAIPPTHQEENIMSYDPFEDLDDNLLHDPGSEGALEDPLDTVGQHIDTFIQIGKHGWDMGLFTFDEDPTYEVEGSPQIKDWYPCIYDSSVWDGDGDIITGLFHPFEDDLSQHLQGGFQSSLGSCDAYPFGDAYLFYEYFHPSSPLILEEYQDRAIPGQSKVHSMKWKFCHLWDSHEDSQMKRQIFSSSRPEPIPYLISYPWMKHGVFLSYLTSYQSSGSSDCVDEDEDEPSSTYASPL
jgi:hypothetical protein